MYVEEQVPTMPGLRMPSRKAALGLNKTPGYDNLSPKSSEVQPAMGPTRKYEAYLMIKMRPSSTTPVKAHRKHIIYLLPQLSSYPFTAPACTPRRPSPALIRCLSSCTIPQPRLQSGAYTANSSTPFPRAERAHHGLEMEAAPFDWNDYLSSEGLSDIVPTGLNMQGGQAGGVG